MDQLELLRRGAFKAIALVLIFFGAALADEVKNGLIEARLDPLADTFISSGDHLTWDGSKHKPERYVNFGNEGSLKVSRGTFGHSGNHSGWREALIRFDLSGIPEHAGILGAELFLYHSNLQGELISIHRMNRGWTELEATWFAPCRGCEPWWKDWEEGDYQKEASDTRRVNHKGWFSWDVTKDVRLFISGAPNHGWLLRSAQSSGSNPTSTRFYSKDTHHRHLRPYLRIRFRSTPLPLVVKITSPKNGDVISGFDVRVEGTIMNSAGNETGVVVNGVLANVWGSRFTANHVPLAEGSNTIVATAMDIQGNEEVALLTVNANPGGPYIRITANADSGVAPLETLLTLDSSLGLGNASLAYSGPEGVEFLSTAEQEYRVRFSTPGVYRFTARVTDEGGKAYEDTVDLTVYSKEEIDALLRGKWQDMSARLGSGDVEDALAFFDDSNRQNYRELFNVLSSFSPLIAQEMADIQLIKYAGDTAIYDIRTVRDGTEYSFQLLFTKDNNGIWKINSF